MRLIRKPCSYHYGDKLIKYDIWSKKPLADVDTVLLLGTMQISLLTKFVCKYVTQNVAVVQCAPHWHANPDGSDIPKFMFEFTKNSIDLVAAEARSSHLGLVSDSQAAPGIIRYSLGNARVKNVTLLQPLGLNTMNFKSSGRSLIGEFRHRFHSNFQYQVPLLLKDPNLLINHLVLLFLTFRETLTRRFDGQYAAGLREDMTDDLKKTGWAARRQGYCWRR